MRRLAVLFVISISFGQASASGLFAQRFAIGAKAGAAYADIASREAVAGDWGFTGAAFGTIDFGKLTVQPEVAYVQRKGTQSTGMSGENTIDQKFVDVAVLLGKSFGAVITTMIYVAPVLSFETSCDLTIDTGSDTCANFAGHSALLSGAVGATASFSLLLLDVRYEIGVTNIEENADGRWNTLMIMGGIGFGIGG